MNVVRSHLGRSHLGSFLPTRTQRWGTVDLGPIIKAATDITTTAITEGAKADAAKARAKAKAKAAKAKAKAAKTRASAPAPREAAPPPRAALPWGPIALGGGLLLAIGIVLMGSRRGAAPAPAYYPPPAAAYGQSRANPRRGRRHRAGVQAEG